MAIIISIAPKKESPILTNMKKRDRALAKRVYEAYLESVKKSIKCTTTEAK